MYISPLPTLICLPKESIYVWTLGAVGMVDG